MTIKDLAAMTGYSVGTVSRVLNNHPNVSDSARKTILAAVEQSGFQLNTNAKQLKQQQSNAILVVVKGIANELFGELIEVIQSQIVGTGYLLHVDYMDEDGNEVLRALQLCREKKPRGILFLGGNRNNFQADFAKIDLPCVLVTNNAQNLGFANLSSVSTDDRAAACCAMETLLEMGHRKIAIIGGDRRISDTSRLRYEGSIAPLREQNIPFDPERDYCGVRFSYQDGYRATEQLLRNGRRFTAIFAVADVMAIGAIRALWDHGLRVPEDVSVIGVDGLPLGNYLVPQLSTIGQSAHQMAIRSVQILLAAIEQDAPASHEVIPFTLYRRESIRRI